MTYRIAIGLTEVQVQKIQSSTQAEYLKGATLILEGVANPHSKILFLASILGESPLYASRWINISR